MSKRKKIWIILSCVVLILGAFGYSYYSTLKRIINEVPYERTGVKLNIKNDFPPIKGSEEGVSKFPLEDKVTPSTILIEKTISINTGCSIETQHEVPEEIINLTNEQVKEYYIGYDSMEFNKEIIIISRKVPYLPNSFVVRLEDKNIIVFTTDSDGKATKYYDFDPIPCQSKDKQLIKGIEVGTLDEVWQIIGDYD